MKKRDTTFDMMKGIGILLMMMCHLQICKGITLPIIYSFHMPLFFLIAGYFAKDISSISSFRPYTIKNARRLLLPYVVTMLMLCAWGAIQAIAKHDNSFFLKPLFSMLVASSDGWQSHWGLIYAGPMWFLIALFVVREIMGIIQILFISYQTRYRDEIILSLSLFLSVFSVLIYPYLPSLPFCISQAFTALAFYVVGWYVHRHSIPWWIYGICILAWPFAMIYGGVELESSIIKYYPLSFIGACGGTYVVYLLCKGITTLTVNHSSVHLLTGSLSWCGLYSLPILCMHELEMYSGLMNSIMLRFSISYERAWGGGIAILFAWIILKIPYLKEVYK